MSLDPLSHRLRTQMWCPENESGEICSVKGSSVSEAHTKSLLRQKWMYKVGMCQIFLQERLFLRSLAVFFFILMNKIEHEDKVEEILNEDILGKTRYERKIKLCVPYTLPIWYLHHGSVSFFFFWYLLLLIVGIIN